MEAILNSPFFGLTMCVSTYIFGRWVQKKTGFVLANPLIIAVHFRAGAAGYSL